MVLSIWETDPRHWPNVSREYVFLAAAFHEVGEALAGGDWTGREALPVATPEADKERMLDGLIRTSKIQPAANVGHRGAFTHRSPVALPQISAERMAEYIERRKVKIAAELVANEEIVARRDRVVDWIASRARNGELATFGCWVDGGGLSSFPASVWNVWPIWDRLFVFCVSPLAKRFYIFVSRDDLDRQLRSIRLADAAANAKPSKGAAIIECVSWLQAEFAKQERLATTRDQFKKEAIERAGDRLSGRGFRTAWTRAVVQFPERVISGRRRSPAA